MNLMNAYTFMIDAVTRLVSRPSRMLWIMYHWCVMTTPQNMMRGQKVMRSQNWLEIHDSAILDRRRNHGAAARSMLTLAAVLSGFLALSGNAAELVQLDKQNIGVPWNTDAADLGKKFPGIKSVAGNMYAYKGPLSIGSLTYNDKVGLFYFDTSGGLNKVYTGLPNQDSVTLINALNAVLGKGRWATYPEGKLFHHVWEWNGVGYFVEFGYTAESDLQLSQPALSIDSRLEIWRDRPSQTHVDQALARPQMAEALRQQYELQIQKQQEEKLARQKAKAEADRAPPALPIAINADSQPPLRKAGNTWGATLNPKNDVPLGSFKAFYINQANPKAVVASEVVKDVAINYSWNDFHGIKSEQFGAYWVGRMKLNQSELRLINVSLSWSKARIMIDGYVVYENGRNTSIAYQFSAGEHLIEVEYLNNWHTTEFKVTFGRQAVRLSREQVAGELQRHGIANAEVHYVGLYESAAKDLSVNVNVGKLDRDVLLVLSSYSAIKWIIKNPLSTRIKAIVYASFTPGSEVAGVDERHTLVLPLREMIGNYRVEPRCDCAAGNYHCEGSATLLSIRAEIEKMTGNHMVGFGGKYGAESMPVPDNAITAESLEKSARLEEVEANKRNQCAKKADPDFENLMK